MSVLVGGPLCEFCLGRATSFVCFTGSVIGGQRGVYFLSTFSFRGVQNAMVRRVTRPTMTFTHFNVGNFATSGVLGVVYTLFLEHVISIDGRGTIFGLLNAIRVVGALGFSCNDVFIQAGKGGPCTFVTVFVGVRYFGPLWVFNVITPGLRFGLTTGAIHIRSFTRFGVFFRGRLWVGGPRLGVTTSFVYFWRPYKLFTGSVSFGKGFFVISYYHHTRGGTGDLYCSTLLASSSTRVLFYGVRVVGSGTFFVEFVGVGEGNVQVVRRTFYCKCRRVFREGRLRWSLGEVVGSWEVPSFLEVLLAISINYTPLTVRFFTFSTSVLASTKSAVILCIPVSSVGQPSLKGLRSTAAAQ